MSEASRNYSVLDGMIGNAGEMLRTAFDKGFRQGVECENKRSRQAEKKNFKEGEEYAVRVVKWLFQHVPDKELFDGNYVEDILNLYSFEDIQKIIMEYCNQDQAEEKPLEVGDEVTVALSDVKGAVISMDGQTALVLKPDPDNGGKNTAIVYRKENLRKTGRHFNCISEICGMLEDAEGRDGKE